MLHVLTIVVRQIIHACICNLKCQILVLKVKHELRVTCSNPQVTNSNPRVTSSNPRVKRLKERVARLKARVEAIRLRVKL